MCSNITSLLVLQGYSKTLKPCHFYTVGYSSLIFWRKLTFVLCKAIWPEKTKCSQAFLKNLRWPVNVFFSSSTNSTFHFIIVFAVVQFYLWLRYAGDVTKVGRCRREDFGPPGFASAPSLHSLSSSSAPSPSSWSTGPGLKVAFLTPTSASTGCF